MTSSIVVIVALCAALNVVTASWSSNFDEPQSFQCPTGQFLSNISSEHNDQFEDRRWNFGCQDIPLDVSVSSCTKTNYINDYDQTFTYQCDGFIAGMDSVHDNYYEDRKFKFLCCAVSGAVAHNCEFTSYQNDLDGELDYQVPDDKILRGVESFHSNYNEDRRFKFEICDFQLV